MGNQESKDESMGCNCSSSSCSSSSFCGSCSPPMTANCHGISFKIAEKSSKSDINRFGKFMSLSSLSSFDYDEQELNTLFYYYFIIISCDSSEVTTTIATDDPPPKKKKLSKATQLEEKVVPVLSLVALDKEISEYKGCSDSSCFKDCR